MKQGELSMTENLKNKFLQIVLKEVPFSGWGSQALEVASKAQGYDEQFYQLLFQGGVEEVVDYYIQSIDEEMINKYKMLDTSKLRTHERIIECIKIRLFLLNENRMVFIKTMGFLINPLRMKLALKTGYRVVDLVWYEAGNDKSTDFNFYTKRGLLYLAYTSTLLYMQNDNDRSLNATIDFFTRRIGNVLKVGGLLSKFKPS